MAKAGKKAKRLRRIGGVAGRALRHPIVAELAAAGLIALAERLRRRRQSRERRPDQA